MTLNASWVKMYKRQRMQQQNRLPVRGGAGANPIMFLINMEEYRSGHNELDSKCVGQCGSYVAENLDFMQFLLTLEFE